MNTKQSSPLTKWKVDGAGAAALAVLTIAAYFFILAPIARSRLALGAVRSELRETTKQANEMRAVESAVNSELTRVQSEIEASPVRLEAADRLNRRLARLMSLASESGLVIHETRAGDIVVGTRFDLVPIEVSGGGSYPNCARFMNRLYTDLPDVEVVGFEISGQPSNPGATASFRFELSWYAAPSIVAAPQERGGGS